MNANTTDKVFATNIDFLIPISLQPATTTTLGCRDIEIRKSEFWQKLSFIVSLFFGSMYVYWDALTSNF